MTHSPYLPDLAPCDFPLFPRLKSKLRGQSYKSVLELRQPRTKNLDRINLSGIDRCLIHGFTDTRTCLKEKIEVF